MSIIEHGHCTRVSEHGRCMIKTDIMLLTIQLRFVGVPLKIAVHRIPPRQTLSYSNNGGDLFDVHQY